MPTLNHTLFLIGTAGFAAAALIAAVFLFAGGDPTPPAQASSSHDLEVRIAARNHDSDRVEFALQQRQPDQTWGEYIRPPARFLPPTYEVGVWGHSTPIPLTAPLPAQRVAVSLDQYIERCGEAIDQTPLSGEQSWGDYADLLDGQLQEQRAVAPPSELADYHAASILFLTWLHEFAAQQQPDSPFDAVILLRPALIAEQLFAEPADALAPDLVSRLTDARCLVNFGDAAPAG